MQIETSMNVEPFTIMRLNPCLSITPSIICYSLLLIRIKYVYIFIARRCSSTTNKCGTPRRT